MHTAPHRSLWHKLCVLLKGAFVGALAMHGMILAGTLFFGLLYDSDVLSHFEFDVRAAVVLQCLLFALWLIGVVLVALPAWYLFRKAGWVQKWHAEILGLVITLLLGLFVYLDNTKYQAGIKVAAVAGLGVVGAMVGNYLWRQFYGVSLAKDKIRFLPKIVLKALLVLFVMLSLSFALGEQTFSIKIYGLGFVLILLALTVAYVLFRLVSWLLVKRRSVRTAD